MESQNNGYIDQLYKLNKLYESGEIPKDRYEYEKSNLEAKQSNKRYVCVYDTMDRGIKLKSDISEEEIIVVKDFKDANKIYANKTLVNFSVKTENSNSYGVDKFDVRLKDPGVYYYNLADIIKNKEPVDKGVWYRLNKILSSRWFRFILILGVIVFMMDQCFKNNARESSSPNSKIERHFSKFDGSYTKFRNYIKSNVKDPSSFKHVETRYNDNKDGTATVWMKYRAKNSFGATVTEIAKCTLNVATGDFSDVVTE